MATNNKPLANYIIASASPNDKLKGYRGNPTVQALVDSAKGWVAICSHMKAEQAASYPIRLYTRAKSPNSKKITGKRLTDLKNPLLVGQKSVQYAEAAGTNVSEISNHPALNCLHKPNPYMVSGQELFYWIFLMEQICGNAFTEVFETKDPNIPLSILPLYPQNMALEINQDGNVPSLISQYIYSRGTTSVVYGWEEVIHFKRAPSPFTPYWGSSPLQSVLAEADLLEMATLNELTTWENGCSVNLAYKVPEDATEEQIAQLRSQFESRHQGIDKSSRLFIGSGELKTIDANPREMQYREGQTYYSQMILSSYRVPESKVRLNDANLASSKTGNIEYLNEAIRPMLVKMAETLTEEILYKRLGYERGTIWFAYDDIVPNDIASIQAAAVGFVQNRIWTPDEARAEVGYPPLPNNEGSKLVIPVGTATPAAPVIDGTKVPQAPQGPAMAAAAAADAATAEAVAAPPADLALNGAQIDSLLSIAQLVAGGQLPAAAAKEILFAAFPTVPVARIDAIINGLTGFTPAAPEPVQQTKAATPPEPSSPSAPTEAPPEATALVSKSIEVPVTVARWQTVKLEGKALCNQKKANGDLLVLGGRVLRAVDVNGKSITQEALKQLASIIHAWYLKANINAYSLEARADELAKDIRPTLEAIFREGGIQGLETLASLSGGSELIASTAASFDVVPTKALEFLKDYTIRLAREISQNQHDDLQSALKASIEQGMSNDEAKNAVQSALGDVANWKAEQIANTEATRAYTNGNIAAWQEAGVEKKKWLLSPEACTLCKGIAAQFNEGIDMNSSFLKKGDTFQDDMGMTHEVTFANLDGPPLHPGDRCDLVPVI